MLEEFPFSPFLSFSLGLGFCARGKFLVFWVRAPRSVSCSRHNEGQLAHYSVLAKHSGPPLFRAEVSLEGEFPIESKSCLPRLEQVPILAPLAIQSPFLSPIEEKQTFFKSRNR